MYTKLHYSLQTTNKLIQRSVMGCLCNLISVLFIICAALIFAYVRRQDIRPSYEAARNRLQRCSVSCTLNYDKSGSKSPDRVSAASDSQSKSGLSKLQSLASFVTKSKKTESDGCVCEACFCPVLRNCYKAFGPILDAFKGLASAIEDEVCNFVDTTKMVFQRAEQCKKLCPREAQLTGDKDGNFRLVPKYSENLNKALDKKKEEKSKFNLFNKLSKSKLFSKSKTSVNSKSKEELKEKPSRDATNNLQNKYGTETEKITCDRCLAQGKTCLVSCPGQGGARAPKSL